MHLNYCIKQGINAAAQPITSYDCNKYTKDEKLGCIATTYNPVDPLNQGGFPQQQVLETLLSIELQTQNANSDMELLCSLLHLRI